MTNSMPSPNDSALLPVASSLAWRRIADALEADIRSGKFGAGDLLPPSTVLAEQFGVHRHTVRQAFKNLAERGLVSVGRGRGTEVLAQRFPYRIGRRVSLRTNFGAAGIPVAGVVVSRDVILASKPVAEALLIRPGDPVHAIRTLNRADGVPVSSGLHFLAVSRFPGFEHLLDAADASITGALKAAGVPDYIRLSTRLTARAATAEEAELLALTEGAPVMQSTGIDALPDQTPIHLVSGVFAGERMEMIVEPFAE
jgi:GntR family phosphonate transport system transcriptional regulator